MGKLSGVPRRAIHVCLLAILLVLTNLPGAVFAKKNAGGVLVLHCATQVSPETPADKLCEAAILSQSSDALTRFPGDGKRVVVFVYAAFDADSVVDMRAVTFGLRFTANVKIAGSGICNGGGLAIPTPGWPSSGTGVSFMFDPSSKERMVPIYWFLVSCVGPGYFEVTPNPNQHMGGNFADSSVPALLEPVAGYGAIGFDLEGSIPVPGQLVPSGACCLGERTCIQFTKEECLYYFGEWLGPSIDCAKDDPCQPEADFGACCMSAGCQTLTRRECTKQGGTFLGEKVPCQGDPCPKPGTPESGR